MSEHQYIKYIFNFIAVKFFEYLYPTKLIVHVTKIHNYNTVFTTIRYYEHNMRTYVLVNAFSNLPMNHFPKVY